MSSLLERLSASPAILNSQATKLTLVAAAASFTTAAVILGVQGSQRKRRVKQLKDDLRKSIPPPPTYEDGYADKGFTDGAFGKGSTVVLPRTETLGTGGGRGGARQQQQQGGVALEMDEELVKEQLARNIAFLGEEGVEKLRKSFVIIVGAGKSKQGDDYNMRDSYFWISMATAANVFLIILRVFSRWRRKLGS